MYFQIGAFKITWCKILTILITTAVMLPIIWYIHEYFCSTSTFFNRIEGELSSLKIELEHLKGHGHAVAVKKNSCQKKDSSKKCSESSEQECNCALFGESLDDSSDGQPDFALESSGGRIISTGDETEPINSGSSETTVFGIPTCCFRNGPVNLIQVNMNPGECWAFKGCEGNVTIKLLAYVFISGVTVQHISQSISPSGNINSAPRDFAILGLKNESDAEGELLGDFTYKRGGPPVQYFQIYDNSESYEIIQMNVLSNHGNPNFTCVYRLQVHGKMDEEKTFCKDCELT